jgi:hypothetical protein
MLMLVVVARIGVPLADFTVPEIKRLGDGVDIISGDVFGCGDGFGGVPAMTVIARGEAFAAMLSRATSVTGLAFCFQLPYQPDLSSPREGVRLAVCLGTGMEAEEAVESTGGGSGASLEAGGWV